MIRYDLRCDRDHAFESWFQSSGAYDSQVKRKLVTCPQCGSAKVEKAIMAPRIGRTRNRGQDIAVQPQPQPAESASLVMAPQEAELRSKLKELRDHIVKTADNVGESFPEEARAMHYGDKEHRPIYGEASLDEARALIDEGIEVAPIPVLPGDRN
ncbi:MAG: DUF1178 family protein [Hyphomicrobiales bacterium]|nr:DUF1178 family protein [Hyphomicrobiales bacterium]